MIQLTPILNAISTVLFKVLTIIKNLLIKISPENSDLILLAVAFLLAILFERWAEFGWKKWLPLSIIIWLLLKVVGV